MHSASNQTPTASVPSAKWLAIPAIALAMLCSGTANAQAYVNVTIGGQFAPGVFGQIAIGNNPPPPVMNAQPVIAGRLVYGAPIMYLHVPPEEYRDWARHCERYRACGHPVHFVRIEQNDRWWERHSQYLRGEDYYRRPEYRHDNRRDHRQDDRDDSRRSDHRDNRAPDRGENQPFNNQDNRR